MFDLTQVTNTKRVFLRAVTRGLITVDQAIYFVICPRTGGVTVTPPAPYAHNNFDATMGGKLVLPNLSLFQ